MNSVMWQPSLHDIQDTSMYKFMRQKSPSPQDENCEADYSSLYRWSIAEPGEFWAAVWSFCWSWGEQGAPAFDPHHDAAMTKSRFSRMRLCI